MSKPLVSVIIPAYNVEEFICPCMDSVLAQTLSNIEVICIDDGSTDGTAKILKQYEKKDNRVKTITQANHGAGHARNVGMLHARGEALSFLDADDFYELNMLEKAYEKIKETNAQFVVFDSDIYYNDKKEYYNGRHIDFQAIPPYEPFHRRSLAGNPFRVFIGWAWDKLFDAEFIRKNKLEFQEQRTTNDMAFVFSALSIGERIAVVNQKMAHHRKNVDSSLSNTRERSWYCFHDALIRVKEFLISHDIYFELEQDYINYALHASLWNLDSLCGKAKEELFVKMKEEWIKEFGLTDKTEGYFDVSKDYQKLLKIQKMDYLQYSRNEE